MLGQIVCFDVGWEVGKFSRFSRFGSGLIFVGDLGHDFVYFVRVVC